MSDSCPSSSCTDCVGSRSSLSGNSCCWSLDSADCYVSYSGTSDCTETASDCPDYQGLSAGAIVGIVIGVLFIICISIGVVVIILRRRNLTNLLGNNNNKDNHVIQPQSVTQQPVVIQPQNNPVQVQAVNGNQVYVQAQLPNGQMVLVPQQGIQPMNAQIPNSNNQQNYDGNATVGGQEGDRNANQEGENAGITHM